VKDDDEGVILTTILFLEWFWVYGSANLLFVFFFMTTILYPKWWGKQLKGLHIF